MVSASFVLKVFKLVVEMEEIDWLGGMDDEVEMNDLFVVIVPVIKVERIEDLVVPWLREKEDVDVFKLDTVDDKEEDDESVAIRELGIMDDDVIMDEQFVVIIPVIRFERVEDFKVSEGLCERKDVEVFKKETVEDKEEDSGKLTKVAVAAVFVWELVDVEGIDDDSVEIRELECMDEEELIMVCLFVVIVLVNRVERVEDFRIVLEGFCEKEDVDVSKLVTVEDKDEDSGMLTKVVVAAVFVWELSKLVELWVMSATDVKEFVEVEDSSPEDDDAPEVENESEEVEEKSLEVRDDDINELIEDESCPVWEGEFVDDSNCVWDDTESVLTTSSDVEDCDCELSPIVWTVEDDGLGLELGFWVWLVTRLVVWLVGLGLGFDNWSEELTVEDWEDGDVEVSCEVSNKKFVCWNNS